MKTIKRAIDGILLMVKKIKRAIGIILLLAVFALYVYLTFAAYGRTAFVIWAAVAVLVAIIFLAVHLINS